MAIERNYLSGLPGCDTALIAGDRENFSTWQRFLYPELVLNKSIFDGREEFFLDQKVRPLFREMEGIDGWFAISKTDVDWLGEVVRKSADKVILNIPRFASTAVIYHDGNLTRTETGLVDDVTKIMKHVLRVANLEFPKDEKEIVEQIELRMNPQQMGEVRKIARRVAGISLLTAADSALTKNSQDLTTRWLGNLKFRIAQALLLLDIVKPSYEKISAYPDWENPGEKLGLPPGVLHWQDPETLAVKVVIDQERLRNKSIRRKYGELTANLAALQAVQLDNHKLKLSVWD